MIKGIYHPGFPRIGAIEIFRKNVVKQLDKGEQELKKSVESMTQYEGGKISHTGKNALRMRKKQDSPLHLNAYFDRLAYEAGNKHIADQIKEKMRHFMSDVMKQAKEKSNLKISDLSRAFKSRDNKETGYIAKESTAVVWDLYDTIAESLDFEETWPSRAGDNQFASYVAGSSEDGTSGGELTTGGVRGSRMNSSGPSLVELTEEGWGSFDITAPYAYFGRIRKDPAKRLRGQR
ncbi:MAG: hypothetical protein CMF55_00770 [Legionellales bacterium]|nr:hypothetical protein [Legionellales bacterium]|tara:strand:+ start:1669 stop:2370 length:702 start_codon:yes stop_codon:yes gene_type:complete